MINKVGIGELPELLLALQAWLRAATMVVGVNRESAKVAVGWGGQISVVSRSNSAV